MATVGTTSITDCLAPSGVPPIARDMSTGPLAGYLYTVVRTATDTLTVYRSTNAGSSWSSFASFTHTGLQEWGSIVIDRNAWGWIPYRVGTSGGGGIDTIWFRRLDLYTGTFLPGNMTSFTDANGGTIGARWTGLDLAVYHRPSTSTDYVVIVGHQQDIANSKYGVIAMAGTVKNRVYDQNHGLIAGNRFWWTGSGTLGARASVRAEVEHNGDGYTSVAAHIWITWGRTKLSMVKLAWNGNGWNGPSTAQTIRSTMPAVDTFPARWDNQFWMMGIISPDDAAVVRIYQRNRANTQTSVLDTPTHPTGNIRQMSLSYDNTTKDLVVYAVGTSTAVLYSVVYDRSAGTWGSWASVVATAVLSSGAEFGVRAGGSAGNARFDVVTAHSGAPNTVVHTAQTVSTAPAVPAFVTSGQAYTNGGPANVSAALPLAWTFSDSDAGQTQGSYALSRQIGAGAVQYYTAGGGTWGGSEVQNASGTQGVTLATAWGLSADANHQYRVKVWDNVGVPSAGYSSPLTLVPSVVVNPTITAPAAAAVLTTDTVTPTWTVSEQTGIRVILTRTSPGTEDVYDSGTVMGYTDLSYTIPYQMPTGTAWTITLYTYNNEGLASTGITRSFTVSYPQPPAFLPTFVASPSLGIITVTPTNLAPVGTQPAITGAELYRRPQVAGQLLSNGTITSTTGWAGQDGGTMTLSAVQVREGTNSLRVVPNGAGAVPRVQVTGAAAPARTDLLSQAYTASGWIRPDTANKSINIRLVFFDAGGTELGTVAAVFANVVAAAWHYVEVTGDGSAFPTAAKVGMALGLQGTPAAGDAFYADLMQVTVANPDTGVRLSVQTGAPVAYPDWGAASGVVYEYKWVPRGANGTTGSSPWVS